jgi:transposase
MDQAEVVVVGQEIEVTEHAKRRSFTAEYKRRIVKEADASKAAGEIGALLRREGLYSSHLCVWRDPRDLEIARLQRDVVRLEKRATRAEALVDIQKKVAALLGRPFETEDS